MEAYRGQNGAGSREDGDAANGVSRGGEGGEKGCATRVRREEGAKGGEREWGREGERDAGKGEGGLGRERQGKGEGDAGEVTLDGKADCFAFIPVLARDGRVLH